VTSRRRRCYDADDVRAVRSAARWSWARAALGLFASCSVDPRFDDKPPPCAPGYVEDPTGTRCVLGVDAEMPPIPPDAGPDADPDAGFEVLHAADVTELRAALDRSRDEEGTQTILLDAATYGLDGEIVIDHDVVIRGPAECAAILDGSAVGRVLRVSDAGLELSGVAVQNGLVADDAGGGILVENSGVLTLRDACVRGNVAMGASAPGGGGIAVRSSSTLEMNRVRVTGNQAEFRGGGILIEGASFVGIVESEVSANSVGGEQTDRRGAGIAVVDGFDVSIESSLLAENTDAGAGLWGGGISIGGDTNASIENTTISSNACEFGTGLFVEGGIVDVSHTTIAANRGSNASSRGVWIPGGTVTFTNTLFAGNLTSESMERNCHDDGAGITGGGNIGPMEGSPEFDCGIEDPSDDGDSRADPLIRGLEDNGGFTRTHALDGSSPAIDLATDCLGTDQRGEVRSEPCESGAIEIP
jgi:hypothetical protein